MTTTILNIKDGGGNPAKLAVEDQGSLVLTPYHLEDATQRGTLISTLNLRATSAKQDTIITALQTLVTNSNNTDPVNIVSTTLASESKLEAVRALLAGTVKTGSVDGAGTPRQLGNVSVTGSLTSATAGSPAVVRGDFNLTTSGDFVGTYVLERGFGASPSTYYPITALGTLVTFNGPLSESFYEAEAQVSYRVRVTSFTSGTLSYRISQ